MRIAVGIARRTRGASGAPPVAGLRDGGMLSQRFAHLAAIACGARW
jgi:hypothetical protein